MKKQIILLTKIFNSFPIKKFLLIFSKYCLIFFISILLSFCNKKESKDKLTLALPTADWWTATPFLISQSDSIFSNNNIKLSSFEVNSGLASKNAVFAGTADIGISASSPLAMAAYKKEGLVVLGTYLSSSSIIGLIIPDNASINSVPPQPIAVVPSTISEFFLYNYLTSINKQNIVGSDSLKELYLRPADIPGALKSGSAKSAVVWEPFLTYGGELPGFEAKRNLIPFEVNLYIITRTDFFLKHKREILDFLSGLKEVCQYINNNSRLVQSQIEIHFDFRRDFLSPIWSKVNYQYKNNKQVMSNEILRDANIAKSLGYIDKVPKIDYLFNNF